MRKIKNYCEFVIKGLNQERFFNDLANSYSIYDINRYERNKTSFKVSIKDSKVVKKKILSAGFEILGQRKSGVLNKIISLKNSYGVIAGLIVCLVLYFVQMPYIWKINIVGVEENLQSEMSHFISENYTLKKGQIDCKEIEKGLREEFSNLSFTSVSIQGQSLVINAKEGEAPVEKGTEFEPIVASCDCRIVDINLIQGTLAIEEGDSVRAGDIIVYPYIIDTFGQQKSVDPKADFRIQTWLVGWDQHTDQRYEFQRTGNYYIENKLFLFNNLIYSHNAELKYEKYENETSQKYFSENNILPFVYQKTIYFEIKEVFIEESYQDVRENKIDSARQKALLNLEESDIITEERYVEEEFGGVYSITYYVTIEKDVSIK